jgi:radical SAM protein with 4Fe4S-binding SPASM domain
VQEIVDRITPVPRRCSWEITLACNLNCSHCGSAAGYCRENELTTEEALNVCDQLANLGCKEVTLLGGEPFLRKDWHLISQKLISHDIDVKIVSNGMLINKELSLKLKDIGIKRMGISLDGAEGTHNHIRNNPRSFQSVFNAIEQLNSVDISVCVITVAMPQNINQLPEILTLLVEKGVKHWQIQLPVPTGRLKPDDYQFSEQDLSWISEFIINAKSETNINVYSGCNVGYFGDGEETIRSSQGGLGFWTGCYAGILLVAIRSNGDVTGCLTMPGELTEGNLREKPLVEIWNNPEAFRYHRQFTENMLSGFCSSCEYGRLCRGGCRTMSYYLKGSLFDDPCCMYRLSQQSTVKEN